FTQNIHPNTKYLEPYIRANPLEYRELRTAMFAYEMDITRAVFEAASDLEQELVVKPHPGEEFSTNFTKELAERHGFTYLPAGACNSRDLILASSAAAASRSAVLNESCLLDRNTAAIVPSIGDSEKDQQMNDVSVFPAASTGAIPIAYQWEEIKAVCSTIWSPERSIQDKLAQRRTLFSVDGKASQRLADIIEELVL
ncbi:MAG: hypothetical protein Q8R53_00115, partial [Nanoarchaeota archaeon]|nr:hypothetical protein [Nanoarchaeota archaeon]